MEVPRLHPDTLEDVKQKVEIVDIISERVVLKKKGKDYQGLCPFHQEKSPSFTVSPSKQMYYCFGCGAGGNAFKFLMELEKRSFSDVVLELAYRYQVPVKTLAIEDKQEFQRQLSLREQLYEILAVTAGFYHHALYQSQGEIALTYLYENRHLTDTIIQQFQLGYAPNGWETLYRYLVEQKHYPLSLIEQAGLIKPRQSGSGYYDQFRNRVMIPIQDSQGRIIAFGSRSLGQDQPKYLNSPETDLFVKGKTLFGLDRAKTAIQKKDQAIMVEGYFDVIALHAHGFSHAVASLGTALNHEQIKQLLRFTDSKQIIFNFDADRAGIKATQRAIQEIEPLVYDGQVNLRILNLPSGKDADEFLYGDPSAQGQYQQLLDSAPLWFDWQIQQLLASKNLKQANDFEQVAQEMIKLLRQLTDPNKQSYYLQYCAEILSQGDSHLMALQLGNLNQQLRSPQKNSASSRSKTPLRVKNPESSLLAEAENLLLSIYIHCPEFRPGIKNSLDEKDLLFSFAHHRQLWQFILTIEAEFSSTSGLDNALLSHIEMAYLAQQQDVTPVTSILRLNEKTQENLFRPGLSIPSAIAALERVTWQKYYEYCSQKFKHIDRQTNLADCEYYHQEMMRSKLQIQYLDQERLTQIP